MLSALESKARFREASSISTYFVEYLFYFITFFVYLALIYEKKQIRSFTYIKKKIQFLISSNIVGTWGRIQEKKSFFYFQLIKSYNKYIFVWTHIIHRMSIIYTIWIIIYMHVRIRFGQYHFRNLSSF